MSDESLDEFLKRGGKINKFESIPPGKDRKHWTQKDKIDVAIGIKRKTGASKMFDHFARAYLQKGNTSWKIGK